jgi:hypothetical protein
MAAFLRPVFSVHRSMNNLRLHQWRYFAFKPLQRLHDIVRDKVARALGNGVLEILLFGDLDSLWTRKRRGI